MCRSGNSGSGATDEERTVEAAELGAAAKQQPQFLQTNSRRPRRRSTMWEAPRRGLNCVGYICTNSEVWHQEVEPSAYNIAEIQCCKRDRTAEEINEENIRSRAGKYKEEEKDEDQDEDEDEDEDEDDDEDENEHEDEEDDESENVFVSFICPFLITTFLFVG
jgi:hypothetical protein